ncbi:MAG: phosphatase PAP2 family protein [Bacteroidota bacterium]
MHSIRIWLLLLYFPLGMAAQDLSTTNSPYDLHWKKEVPLLSFGLGSTIGGVLIVKNVEPYAFTNAQLLPPTPIGSFDESARSNWSHDYDKASDVLMYGSILLPLSLGLDKEIRRDYMKIGMLFSQTFTITQGLTAMTKGLVKRDRPYLFNPDAPLSEKQSRSARLSFFSGHTATVSSLSFFSAKVWTDYHPDSKWKPLVWSVAAVLPAATGYFRYKAGKHYPSDVITGYAVGALVGFVVPHLHKKRKGKKYTFRTNQFNGQGFQLVYLQKF